MREPVVAGGSRRIARVPRPAITLPAFEPADTELARADLIWPLRHEPELEPHADLATYYGATSWRSLCESRRDPRGVDRDEAAAYLAAWCSVRRDDLSIIRQQLVVLARAKSSAIALAARDDVISILALDDLTARSALVWLQTVTLTGHWELDALSAAYVAVGREDDARLVAREYARGPAWVGSLDCRSLVRVRALLHEPWVRDAIEARNPAEPTCRRIAETLDRIDEIETCPLWSGTDSLHEAACTEAGCAELDRVLAPCGELAARPAARLAIAYRHWPSLEGDPAVWVQYARYVGNELPEARVLASAALENAALASDCGDIVPVIRALAATLGDAPAPRYLRALDRATCEKRHSPTLDLHLR